MANWARAGGHSIGSSTREQLLVYGLLWGAITMVAGIALTHTMPTGVTTVAGD